MHCFKWLLYNYIFYYGTMRFILKTNFESEELMHCLIYKQVPAWD